MNDRHYIGGSDAAAACGLDPWRSPVQLWLEKTGQAPEREESEAMRWGTRLQPLLAEWVTEESEGRYIVHQATTRDLRHPDHDWMAGHLDGYAEDATGTGVLELKTAGIRVSAGWDDDQIPIQYQVQGQHYLAVTGLPFVVYGALIGGQRFVIRRMERDQDIIDLIIEREAELWRKIETREPPAPTAQDTELLKLLYPSAVDQKIVTLDHLPDVRRRYQLAKEGIKAAETALSAVENEIKGAMGDAGIATLDGAPAFRWPNHLTHRLDATRLKEELPDVHAAYYKEASQRRFSEVKR